MTARKALPLAARTLLLHEAGYKCANPACRGILTLDIHHLEYVSEGGSDKPENLLAVCPTCHALHHAGHIPIESLRTWKLLLLSLNEAFDRRSVDTLLALDALGGIMMWGDGLLSCSSLVASQLVTVEAKTEVVTLDPLFDSIRGRQVAKYWVCLSEKGQMFVDAWKSGDQQAAVSSVGDPNATL